jgi:hypothetical protein
LLPGNSYKTLDDSRVWKGHVTALAFTSRISTVTQQLKLLFRMSDQGFVGETEASSGGVIGEF